MPSPAWTATRTARSPPRSGAGPSRPSRGGTPTRARSSRQGRLLRSFLYVARLQRRQTGSERRDLEPPGEPPGRRDGIERVIPLEVEDRPYEGGIRGDR